MILQVLFPRQSLLERQVLHWIHRVPDLVNLKAEVIHGDPLSLTFSKTEFESCLGGKDPELLPEVRIQSVDNQQWIPEKEVWQFYPWSSTPREKGKIRVLISRDALKEFLIECFRLSLYRIKYAQTGSRVLLEFEQCPRYLQLLAAEKWQAEVFQAHSRNLFTPVDYDHPVAKHFASSEFDTHLGFQKVEVFRNLKLEDLLEKVKFGSNSREVDASLHDSNLEVQIEVSLQKDTRYEKPQSYIWFYEESERERLESWVASIHSQQRKSFQILRLQLPWKGYFLMKKTGSKPVSPPQATKSFYSIYPGEEVFCPVGLKPFPFLPEEEFEKVFERGYGQRMLLWDEGDSLIRLDLKNSGFEELEKLVNYVLSDYSEQIRSFQSMIFFDDPKVELYDWEAAQKPSDNELNDPVEEAEIKFEDVPKQEQPLSAVLKEEMVAQEAPSAETTDQMDYQAIVDRLNELRNQYMLERNFSSRDFLMEMAYLEARLENHRESLACAELLLFFHPDSREELLSKVSLFDSFCKLRGVDTVAIRNQIQPDNSGFRESDIEAMGIFLICQFTRLKQPQKEFFRSHFLRKLEESYGRIQLSRLVLILVHLSKLNAEFEFLFHKVKDHVLSRLFESGLVVSVDLPAFILDHDFLQEADFSSVENFYQTLLPKVANESTEGVKNRIPFFLIFAIGHAQNQNTTAASACLQEARRLVSLTKDPIHEALYEAYSELAQSLMSQEGSSLGYREKPRLEKLNELNQASKYKVNNLLERSTIFGGRDLGGATHHLYSEWAGLGERTDYELVQLIPREFERVLNERPGSKERQSFNRKRAFLAFLQVLPRLGEAFCFQIIDQIWREFPLLTSIEHRAAVLGKMLSIAYLFENREYCQTFYSEFLKLVDEVESSRVRVLNELLVPVVDYFAQYVDKQECLFTLEKMQQKLEGDYDSGRVMVLMARVFDQLQESEPSRDLVNRAVQIYIHHQSSDRKARLEFFQAMLHDLKPCTFDLKQYLGSLLIQNFEKVNDHLSMNEHCSVSKVLMLEFLISVGKVDEEMSPELKNFLMDFEFSWRKSFFQSLESLTPGEGYE